MSPERKAQSILYEAKCDGPRVLKGVLRYGCGSWEAPYFAEGHFFCYPHYNAWRDNGGSKGIRLQSPLGSGKCQPHHEWLNEDGSIRFHF